MRTHLIALARGLLLLFGLHSASCLPLRAEPLPDETGPETLSQEQAVALALERSPVLQAAGQRVSAARGSLRARSAANNPELSLGATVVPDRAGEPGEARGQFPDTDETNLRYTFPTSGKRRSRTRVARAEFDEAAATLRTEELDLTVKVKLSYIDLQVAQAAARVQEESYQIAVSLSEAARSQHRLGLVPETNVLRTRIDVAQAEQDLLRSRVDARVKEEQLGLTIGLPARRHILARDPLEEVRFPAPPTDLWREADARRPEVLAARHAVHAARAGVDLARRDRRPDLTVQTAFVDGLTNTGNPPVKSWFSLPLWDRGQIAGEVERARAEVRVREQLLEQARRQVQTDVTTAVEQRDTARRVLAVFREDVIPGTKSLLQKARAAYLAGLGTLLDVLDAQRVYRQSSLDRLRALGDHQRALAVLERAVGGNLNGVATGLPGVAPYR